MDALSCSSSQVPSVEVRLDEVQKENGDIDFDALENAQIASGNRDILLSKVAQNLIKEIIASKDLEKTNIFFNTVGKMSPSYKEDALLSGYLALRTIHDLQWIALRITEQIAPHKDLYLHQLVDECKKTKNKEIAIQAANAISHPGDKKKYLAKINW